MKKKGRGGYPHRKKKGGGGIKRVKSRRGKKIIEEVSILVIPIKKILFKTLYKVLNPIPCICSGQSVFWRVL